MDADLLSELHALQQSCPTEYDIMLRSSLEERMKKADEVQRALQAACEKQKRASVVLATVAKRLEDGDLKRKAQTPETPAQSSTKSEDLGRRPSSSADKDAADLQN
eukprot:11032097-Prorocentrum_lima.AAC.1